MTEPSFVSLKKEHINEILNIEKAAFPEPWTKEMFEREILLPFSYFFVVKLKEKIVGYAGYWIVIDEAHILNLAVHSDFRNQGIGKKILGHLIKSIEKEKIKRVLLEVRKSNKSAQKLYGIFGFKKVGIRPKYYKTEDAILMDKSL